MKFNEYLKSKQRIVDMAIAELLPSKKAFPPVIHEAMRYSLRGGKRVRAIPCLASTVACKGKEKDACKTAAALEMIHAYSLVHDDLPAMDNDDTRRGAPSCHKKYNEATAILTGDALLTYSFNLLSDATPKPRLNNRLIQEISQEIGTMGMIGGQLADIEKQNLESSQEKIIVDMPMLEYITAHKTGALIAISCRAGAIVAGATKREELALYKYGEYIGFAFQVIDDILDNDGYIKLFGRKGALERAKVLTEKAKDQLKIFSKKKPLIDLADFIIKRKK